MPAPIAGNRFVLTAEALDAAWTPKTKALILNTPWNPVGTVLTRAELEAIADFCVRRNVALLSDEIYETLLFDGRQHISPLAVSPELRDRAVMTLEHAVHRITEEPAKLFGIEKRGRIKPGMAADFAIFDLATVGSSKRGEMRNDLPGGGRRLVVPSNGVEYTIVNGTPLFEHGKDTGARPGQVLRSGRC